MYICVRLYGIRTCIHRYLTYAHAYRHTLAKLRDITRHHTQMCVYSTCLLVMHCSLVSHTHCGLFMHVIRCYVYMCKRFCCLFLALGLSSSGRSSTSSSSSNCGSSSSSSNCGSNSCSCSNEFRFAGEARACQQVVDSID